MVDFSVLTRVSSSSVSRFSMLLMRSSNYKVGERVRIVDGPFNDFRGIVSEIDMERTKVRVMVSFFGRETPVELDFLQVEKA